MSAFDTEKSEGIEVIVGAMVLAICATSAFTQADERFRIFNKTQDSRMGRSERSALWERGLPPVDRHFSFYAVDPEEEEEIRDDRGVVVEFREMCKVEKYRRPHQDNDPGYEFMPPYYDEIVCSKSSSSVIPPNLSQCTYPYECLQRKREMLVGRRRKGASTKCWEFVPVIVRSGCDCMWPAALNP